MMVHDGRYTNQNMVKNGYWNKVVFRVSNDFKSPRKCQLYTAMVLMEMNGNDAIRRLQLLFFFGKPSCIKAIGSQ